MWPLNFLKKKSSLPNARIDQVSLKHLAIIMDGNGRWAKQKNQARIFGHRQGVLTTERIIESCTELGISYLTLYAFSQQNWQRSKLEIKGLMQLLNQFLSSKLKKMIANKIHFNTIGDIKQLPQDIQDLIAYSIDQTKQAVTSPNMTLTLALSYGGREEILRAVKHFADDLSHNKVTLDQLNETLFSSYLDTAGLPDPDLIIRSSGELRSSNFLPWQSTYAEYYFSKTLWPDFSVDELKQAINAFNQRERRFGASQVLSADLPQHKEHL